MYKAIIASILLALFLAACSSYATPPEKFLNAQIQFDKPEWNKKKISVTSFVDSVKESTIGDQETTIRGWVKGDKSWTLVSTCNGVKYEYRFTDILTDGGGNAIAVLQSIYCDGRQQDTATLLIRIIK
jgi:hypothetical protein